MEIRKAMIDELLNCKWLQNCGEQKDIHYDFDVFFQHDYNKAIRTITSTDWENICLEERGNITGHLAVYNKDVYNKNWNQLAKKIKSEVLPQILEKIREGISIKCLPESVIEDIKFNLVTILISDSFSDYYKSDFYNRMFRIYTSGHLPCGWEGEFPSGQIIVY